MNRTLYATICLIALAAWTQPALARQSAVPDHAELGPNAKGDQCVADRYWNDPGATDPFAVSLALSCRGTTAGRHLAVARRVRASEAAGFEKLLECGAARDFDIPGLGRVQSRRCHDSLLGLPTIETVLRQGDYVLSVSAVELEQAPAERALRLLAGAAIGADANREARPVVDASLLAASPHQSAVALELGASDNEALDKGLRFIRAGLYAEASRVLSEALARLSDTSPVETRLELLLLAGLADSNLSYPDSAALRFKQAEQLLKTHASLADAANLDRKRLAYAALDLLNQQDFDAALVSLNKLTLTSDKAHPLLDPAVLVSLNQTPQRARRSVGQLDLAPDGNALSQVVIDAQANWARSIVLLSQGKSAEAIAALDAAAKDIKLLVDEKVSQQEILWLEARVERQRARLLLAGGDQAEALKANERAIKILQSAESNGEIGPVIAETEFERAAILARNPAGKDDAIRQFGVAVDQLVKADVQGVTPPPEVTDYLDLLIAGSQSQPNGPDADLFFTATQVVADPAIARQSVELQSLVTSAPGLAAKKQEEQDLNREIARLRYEASEATDPARAKALETQSDQSLEKLTLLQAELYRDPALSRVSNKAASIAEIQKVLEPDEAYFKIIKVRDSLFGILIDRNGSVIYHVATPAAKVDGIAKLVRDSIDGGGKTLNIFNVRAANALFQLVTGPVTVRLMAAKSLIVDAGGPLQQLPIGVLVADKESVANFAQSKKKDAYDYTKVDFVARHLSVSVALSPRSLIVSRALPASAAPLPFMGFAQHEPAPMTAQGGDAMVSIGSNCTVERKDIALLTNRLRPVSASELARAGTALGLAHVPSLTGAAFTDTAIMHLTDLNQFQVLHFATHGVTEGQWGCSTAPPGLVTSLGGADSAALLSFQEIARLPLDANLVVLSACDTSAGVTIGQARAAGQEEAGASLEGLVRAFLAANARAVLSTYWQISDAGESEELMADFYHKARSGTIGDALRSAQIEILSKPESSHPFFWGAFFIVGDSHKSLLTGQARSQLALGADSAGRP